MAKTDGSRADFVFDDDVAFLFTGPFHLTAWKNGQPDQHETDQLATRMKYVHFARPAPPRQGKALKPCPFCWSRWVLLGQLFWLRQCGHPLDEFMAKVAAALEPTEPQPAATARPSVKQAGDAVQPNGRCSAEPQLVPVTSSRHEGATSEFYEQLASIMEWRRAGHLSESEFVEAKRRLGLH